MRDAWNLAQYERFGEQRAEPFFDLLALVQPRPQMRVIDLGCGSGELTRALHEQLGARETLGLDSSAAMLERSAQYAIPPESDNDGLRFELGDIAQFAALHIAAPSADHPWDLVFSNAALQWLPDHHALLAQLTALLSEHGQLAFQVPANGDHPAQALIAQLAVEPPYADVLEGFVRISPVLPPEEYSALLHSLGFAQQHVRLQVYGHLLEDSDAVAEWTRGTLLTDYQRRMPAELYERFFADYRTRLRENIGSASPYFYTFKRILCWAMR